MAKKRSDTQALSEIEEKVGIEEFTRLCRESVQRYVGDWARLTDRTTRRSNHLETPSRELRSPPSG
jgi:isoleucyl-tRNA synthetase